MTTPFDLSNLGGLMGGLQKAMQEMKNKAAALRVEGTAGNGQVTVTASGDNEIVSVQITDAAMADRELLEDMVQAATNVALRNAREQMAKEMSSLTGGLPIPPGMIPPGMIPGL